MASENNANSVGHVNPAYDATDTNHTAGEHHMNNIAATQRGETEANALDVVNVDSVHPVLTSG